MRTKQICIVSSSCLSSGPRVEKEADALSAAGHRVHVLVCHTLPWMPRWDAELASGKSWTYEATTWGKEMPASTQRWRIAARGTQYLAQRATRLFGLRPPLAELALSDRVLPLLRRGIGTRADLFIAHNLAALPVAAELARRNHALLAFDAEDDHVGEFADADQPSPQAAVVDAVQARYLPRCCAVTAASDGIADTLAARYGIARPRVVHNVFPWALRERIDGRHNDRRGPSPSLYWFSQSIGLDRGLQDLIAAGARLRGDFQIHLRGHAPDDVQTELMRLATIAGVERRITFHPQVHPRDLLSRTAEHDVGFALEQPVSANRLNTVTNKLFYYMVAGLAFAATDTPGQRRVMGELPAAGFAYPPGDAAALAARLQRWLDEPEALAAARAASLEAARSRWCWEIEQAALLAAYEPALMRIREAT